MSQFLIDNIIASSGINLNNLTIPSSADDPGTAGDIVWDSNYVYVCTATDTWKRVSLAGWSGTEWVQTGSDINGSSDSWYFGYAVDISGDGDTICAGSYSALTVRVYTLSGSSWIQRGSDITAGSSGGDWFGHAVSLNSDGTIIAVGSKFETGGGFTNAGGVRIYQWSGSSWSQLGSTIYGQDAFEDSGHSVSLNGTGNLVAIGARGGSVVRIYYWDGSSWSQRGSDISGLSGDEFGWSVHISNDGTRVAVGAKYYAPAASYQAGSTSVYEWSGSAWNKIGSDITGSTDDKLGTSVSLDSDGSHLAIGAPGDGLTNTGYVAVYQFTDSSWTQIATNISGVSTGDRFGYSVRLNSTGDTVVIGSPGFDDTNKPNAGSIQVLELSNGVWTQKGATIKGQAGGDQLGHSVSISNNSNNLIAGAPYSDPDSLSSAGHIVVYKYV